MSDDLEDKKQTWLQRMFGAIVVFAVLGAVVLFIASQMITSTFNQILPK